MAKAVIYEPVVEQLFARNYRPGDTTIAFTREEMLGVAEELDLVPKNPGDVLYAFRGRRSLPKSIIETQPEGKLWVILGAGVGLYQFKLFKDNDFRPRDDRVAIKIPAATPEIVLRYKLKDEQALLAVVRYNRLIDLFQGITAYSLQSHLRTTVSDIGQIEIDELYVGVGKSGAQFVVPVQAKGGRDRIAISQIVQDHEFCKEKFPNLVPCLVAAQFMGKKKDRVALLELEVSNEAVLVRKEEHFQLVSADQITDADLASYKIASH